VKQYHENKWLQGESKRRLDKAVCLALAAPVGAASLTAAGLIKQIDKINPIFRQKRYGDMTGSPFEILKLTTMPGITEHTSSAGKHDPRASELGMVLRRTHVDEFPQLVNVWRGEMSIVGPRPLVPASFEDMMNRLDDSEQDQFVAARRIARPGLVDPYSAYAYHSADVADPRDMALAHIEYAESAHLRDDLKIIGAAGALVFRGITERSTAAVPDTEPLQSAA
jgi:lipopolysaccharide/colanic/teichoic acid biosynthesis glycosyltransferase